MYSEATALLGVKAKAFHRQKPLTGDTIRDVTGQVVNDASGNPATITLLDSSGLEDSDSNGLMEHDELASTMWLPQKDNAGGVEFHFAREFTLGTIVVWNYNERGRTKRGVRTADIFVWVEDLGWRRMHNDLEFAEAEGSFDYDEPVVIEFDGVRAQKARFSDLTNFENATFIGLSEVQFFEERERASRPHPVDGGTLAEWTTPTLTWIPGDDATCHRVHFGNDPHDLQLVANLENGEFDGMDSLEKRRRYYWRVDTEKTDGSVVEGELWRFSTGHLVAQYQFDNTDGDIALDSSGDNLHGRLMGDACLVSDPERGNVLHLDGDGDYVDCGNDGRFNIVSELTLAAWIKTGQYESQCHAVITKSDRSWRLEKDPVRPEVSFGAWNLSVDTDVACCSKTPLDDGAWHHIVGVYDGAQMPFYTDGRTEASVRATGTIGIGRWKVLIGENPIWSGREWKGRIDDVRIYSYALTEEEVEELYESTKGDGQE